MNENNTPPITDEQRRLAESKKLTLDPIHTRVVTDDVPDEQLATNHLVSPPIANVPNDTEQNSQPIQPAQNNRVEDQPIQQASLWHRSAPGIIILVIFIFGGVVTGAVFFLVQ